MGQFVGETIVHEEFHFNTITVWSLDNVFPFNPYATEIFHILINELSSPTVLNFSACTESSWLWICLPRLVDEIRLDATLSQPPRRQAKEDTQKEKLEHLFLDVMLFVLIPGCHLSSKTNGGQDNT